MKIVKSILILFTIGFLTIGSVSAQEEMMKTKEELLVIKAEKAAALAAAQAELAAVDAKIASIPGWRIGGAGVVGFNLNGNNNWYVLNAPNAVNNSIGIGFNGFANNIQKKFFWRNLLNVTAQRTATKIDSDADEAVVALTEGLDLSSLYGYRLNPKIAVSAEGKFTTSIISYDSDAKEYSTSFFDPAKLTVSAGITWTPIDALVVLIHPIGYELNFPGNEFISAPGAKVGAQYSAQIFKGISWASNLSMFVPYSGGEATLTDVNALEVAVPYDAGQLFNYTWLNGFSAKVFNGITVALNLGLRGDNQIADRAQFANIDSATTEYQVGGLALQSFYTLGLGYTF